MASRGLLVRRWSFILITLLSLPSALSDRVVEKLFFKSPVSDSGSRRAVQAGEDVILECEAAGRPSPTIYWEYDGVRLSPVYYINLTLLSLPYSFTDVYIVDTVY